MTKKFDVYKNELVDILIKRAKFLSDVDWYLELETGHAIESVESALEEYKYRVKEFQKSVWKDKSSS